MLVLKVDCKTCGCDVMSGYEGKCHLQCVQHIPKGDSGVCFSKWQLYLYIPSVYCADTSTISSLYILGFDRSEGNKLSAIQAKM
jgi:hypothetical protein